MYPFYYDETVIMLRKPDPSKSKWRTLIDPFSWPVHLAILSSLPVATFILYFLEKYNPFYSCRAIGEVIPGSESNRNDRGPIVLRKAYWYLLGVLLNQGK
jgi:hypothetical protein